MNAGPRGQGLSHPFPTPPAPEAPVEVAPGIHWVRVPLAMPPGHVNAYVLAEDDGWCVIDPGTDTPETRALWTALLAGPFAGRPVSRLLVTHHHPDHVGLAGWMTRGGIDLLMTRTAWLTARSLILDRQDRHSDAAVTFWRRGGVSPDEIARRLTEVPWNAADYATPLAPTFTRIVEDQVIRLGGRDWTVRCGDGHAPEHATLWRDDIVIGGDQLLPGISPNLGVWPSEPEADPVGEWIASCARLAAHATDDQLVLPGHKLPYRGLPFRLATMQHNHHAALDRLAGSLTTPARAVDCFGTLFARAIGPAEFNLALAEALGHLNHLTQTGRVTRTLGPDGAYLWQA